MALLLSALALGCQGDYPLEPTACDHWCRLSQRPGCARLDPAECVVACEEFGDAIVAPPCDALFQQLLSCLEQMPDALYCKCQEPRVVPQEGEVCPCVQEAAVLALCVEDQDSDTGSGR